MVVLSVEPRCVFLENGRELPASACPRTTITILHRGQDRDAEMISKKTLLFHYHAAAVPQTTASIFP
jgi:hypothetical protein